MTQMYNPDGMSQGAQAVMLGAKAALGSRSGIAGSITYKFKINFVTKWFIAYILCIVCVQSALFVCSANRSTCQVRYALSEETKFSTTGAHGFNYTHFFKAIIKVIDGIEDMGPEGEGQYLMVFERGGGESFFDPTQRMLLSG